MAPLTKDTLEVANPAGQTAVSQAGNQQKPTSGHMRSDAVSLEVPVRVHGSRVTEVVLETTSHTEPFEEQTSTMIIFPQGGVIRMNTPVSVGQMLVLTNLKSRQDAICRVVKVRPNAKLAAYIEVEFTQRQHGYWGDAFPSDLDPVADKVAPSAPASSAGSEFNKKPASDISWAPSSSSVTAPKPLGRDSSSKEIKPVEAPPPPTERFVPDARPEPSFISIGSQEEVQPAASATSQLKSKPGAFNPPAPKSPAPVDFPAASPAAAPPASLSMSQLQGDEVSAATIAAHDSESTAAEIESSALAAAPSSESARSTFGSFAGGNTLAAARTSSPDDFGARLDSSFGSSASQAAQPRVNWMLIAAIAAVVIVVLGGGLFFRSRSSNGRSASSSSPAAPQQTAQQTAPTNSSNAPASNSAAQQPNIALNSAPQLPIPNGAPAGLNAAPAAAAKPAAAAPSQPVADAKPVAPKVTPGMMSQSLSSHPTASQRADASGADAAPDVAGESDGASAALSGISSGSHVPTIAPPTIQPEQPVRIGGDVKEPRLISSALPVYPLGARQSGVEGDVVVNTTIDKNGSVVEMHVASGPPLLRQAALDALRRWKYEPSKLNGQPVAVQLQVIIKFRR